MNDLRMDECMPAFGHYQRVSDRAEALRMIRKSVAKRRSLISGSLDSDDGKHCAIGCFWTDFPRVGITKSVVQEIAAVNDRLPASTSPKKRWKYVMAWLTKTIEETEKP